MAIGGSQLTLMLVGTALISSNACRSGTQPPTLPGAPVYERGLHLFPSPRTFDPPGTIFRVDHEGVRRVVVDLSTMLSLPSRPEAIPTMRATGVLSAELLLGWLGIGGVARAGVERIDTVSIYVAGARREQAYEVDLKELIDSASKLVDWSKPGEVYVITETVSADTVDIGLSKSLRAVIGKESTADSASRSGVDISWHPQGTTQLRMRFDTPHRVFYKAERLVRRTGGIEPDSVGPVLRLQVDSALVWSQEQE